MALKLVTDYGTMENPYDKAKPGLHSLLQGKAQAQKGMQSNQIGTAKVRGVCFRVSYKWLVTTWKGATFKAEGTNMEKTLDKQMEYLKQADTMVGQQYSVWFKNANALSKSTLQTWGAKHGHSCDDPYTTATLSTAAPFQGNPDTAMIVGFFGLDDGKTWGHATAYCCRNANRKFFDINYGVYEFGANDVSAPTLESWIKAKYEGKTQKINDFVLYRIY